MAKEFKTIDELVGLLESRNIRTDASTAGILKREGYYPVVNGYKDPFLDRDAMQGSDGDVYKSGTTFGNIYDLFLFDRALRGAVFPFLTRAESIMKNAVVYSFCERNRGQEDYLDRSNYVSGRDMLVPDGFAGDKKKLRNDNLNDLMGRLNSKLKIRESTRPFIRHYLEAYGTVPLWVLQNDLTFGNIEHFYQLQKRGVQNGACRIVGDVAGNGARIGARQMLRAFAVLVGFRNICAHEDRLYCADVKGAHFDEMLNMVALVLPAEELDRMQACIMMVMDEFGGGRIDPSALNAMYTDESDIPEEFK